MTATHLVTTTNPATAATARRSISDQGAPEGRTATPTSHDWHNIRPSRAARQRTEA
ncbi:hypothetical protein [Streptomyces yatensis]|uniref:hypothetical protein n=1 Tax=Streptomyces yatensis TaxID=155177 RepID=UPI001B3C6510|nr:hypothetical protein [Streptomyces yatensis]